MIQYQLGRSIAQIVPFYRHIRKKQQEFITKERCQQLKNQNSMPNGNRNDLLVEVLLKRLEQLGISIDLSKLRLVK